MDSNQKDKNIGRRLFVNNKKSTWVACGGSDNVRSIKQHYFFSPEEGGDRRRDLLNGTRQQR